MRYSPRFTNVEQTTASDLRERGGSIGFLIIQCSLALLFQFLTTASVQATSGGGGPFPDPIPECRDGYELKEVDGELTCCRQQQGTSTYSCEDPDDPEPECNAANEGAEYEKYEYTEITGDCSGVDCEGGEVGPISIKTLIGHRYQRVRCEWDPIRGHLIEIHICANYFETRFTCGTEKGAECTGENKCTITGDQRYVFNPISVPAGEHEDRGCDNPGPAPGPGPTPAD